MIVALIFYTILCACGDNELLLAMSRFITLRAQEIYVLFW